MNQFDPKTQALFKHKGYLIEKEIGHGAFGKVYKGTKYDRSSKTSQSKQSQRENGSRGTPVAIKVIHLDQVGADYRARFLPRELEALISIHHPNAIALYDIMRAGGKVFIFMEFAPGGDLADLVEKEGRLSELRAGKLFGQTAYALAYIHESYRMCHRDIKLNNVLLDAKSNAKLSDFGFAKECWDSKKHCVVMSDSYCGTPAYSCPQIIEKMVYNPFLADAFSMGVMLYAMLDGEFLFFGTVPEMLTKIKDHPTFVEHRCRRFSSGASKLIIGMVDPREETRTTMHKCVDNKWIKKHCKQ